MLTWAEWKDRDARLDGWVRPARCAGAGARSRSVRDAAGPRPSG